MRKRAFLFAILSMFVLTSCDMLLPQAPSARRKSSRDKESELVDETSRNNESSSYRTSSRESSSSSVHRHSFTSWELVIPPTCTEYGREECYCECGETKARIVDALGHDFVLYDSLEATCYQEGFNAYRCSRCDETYREIIKGEHHWSSSMEFGPYQEGEVPYEYSFCNLCDTRKIEIRALDGTLASGSSIKYGTTEGFMKLSSNGNSISWTFNNIKGQMYCMLYQRGFMDSYQNNMDRSYAHYSSATSETREEGNFTVKVNDEVVDKSEWLYTPFRDFFGEETNSDLGNDCSQIANCPIGQCLIKDGVNTITYQRTGSYNLLISHLVLILNPGAPHTHIPSNEWSYNDTSHWHNCIAADCPSVGGMKLDLANHTWGEKYDEVASTCSQTGSYKERCQVCGYERQVETPIGEHDWYIDTSYGVVQPTKTSSGSYRQRCSICDQEREVKLVYGETKETALTVDEAVEIGSALELRGKTEKTYYVKGVISEIVQIREADAQVTLWLSSTTTDRGFEFYRVSIPDKDTFDYSQLVAGAEVLGHGQIYYYSVGNIEFSGAGCYLDEVKNNAERGFITNSFIGQFKTTGGETAPIILSITNSLAYARVSTDTFYTTYEYNADSGFFSIYLNETFGSLEATLLNGNLTHAKFTGPCANEIANNGYFRINKSALMYDCSGSNEELLSIFKRRYRQNDMWVVDTNNTDRITSVNDATMGNCLRLRAYANGAVALNAAQDFETPIECKCFGFWVYNPSDSNITLRMWLYKGTGHTNAYEIGNVTAVAGQWTYCYMGVQTLSTYNFQIADFTNSGVALLFKNISFFA